MAAGLADQVAKSRGRSRHGTAIDRIVNGVAFVGRHRPPPDARVQQPTALIEVGAEQRAASRTAIDRDSCWAAWTKGGTPRAWPCSPTVFPLLFPSDIDC